MRLARSTAFMRHPQALDARAKALDVITQYVHIIVEGIQFGARYHVARFLGDELGSAVGQIDRTLARVLQGAAQGVGHLHAQYLAEHADERLPPVWIEALASCCRRRASSASPATRTRPLLLDSPRRALASSGSCASTPARLLRTARSASCASTGPTRSWSPSTLMRIASDGASRVRSMCRPSRLASAWRVSGSSASARFRAIWARPATGLRT